LRLAHFGARDVSRLTLSGSSGYGCSTIAFSTFESGAFLLSRRSKIGR